jgi:hypothetical protein
MTAPDSILAITTILASTAAAIRAFRAIENQSLLAIRAGKALWAEVYKKINIGHRIG